MQKRTSLKDIAQLLGVSTALVSYVLNNKKEGRINREVAKKIRETAAQLNYRTNQIARSLKTSKTFTIGLVVADISNPFSSGLARIIEDEAEKYGYTVIFGSSDENALKSDKLIDTLLNRQVDGLIVLPPDGAEEQILALKKREVPFVLVDRYYSEIGTNSVRLNNFGAAEEAVQHLIAQNRQRIGMITYQTSLLHLQERKKGYASALKKEKIKTKPGWLKEVSVENYAAETEAAIRELLSLPQPVNALLLGSNFIAIEALKYLSTLPVKIPEELAIASFDETLAFDFFPAPITYIKQPLREMGCAAVKILVENIAGKKELTQAELSAELIVRK